MIATGEPIYFTWQSIAELWNVATRPLINNGLGFSISRTQSEVGKIEQVLTLLPESPAAYAEWMRLVVRHNVRGSKVHDTKLVAAMNVHRVRRLLTFNTADFARHEIETLDPKSVVSGSTE